MAKAIKASQTNYKILVDFEFLNPDEILTFCDAMDLLEKVKDMQEVEKRIADLKKRYEDLDAEYLTLYKKKSEAEEKKLIRERGRRSGVEEPSVGEA